MTDQEKSKTQLIKELAELRQRLAQFEAQPPPMLENRAQHTVRADFVGREVACRSLGITFQELKRKGLPIETLTRGVPYPVEHLLNKHERINWGSYRLLMANGANIWSDEAWIEMGTLYFKSPWARPVSLMARLLFTVREFYRWAAKPDNMGRDFSCIDVALQEPEDGSMVLTISMQPGYEPCREFFLITQGVIMAQPTVLGLPPAQVQMELLTDSARYQIQIPSGGGTLAWLRKAITWPFTVRAAAQELRDAYELLQVRYTELARQVEIRTQVEEALRQSEAKLNAAQERARLGSWEYNVVTGQGHWSQQMYHLYGIDPALGVPPLKEFIELIHPDDRALVVQAQQQLIATRQPTTTEFRTNPENGPVKYLASTPDILKEENGQVTELTGSVIDITEQKLAKEALQRYLEKLEEMVEGRTKELVEAQERLVRQEKLAVLGQLAGGISHELRNPLGVISNAVYLLQVALPDANDEVKNYLKLIDERLQSANRIISGLLNVARNRPTDREECLLLQLIAETVQQYPPPEGIIVTTPNSANLPPVYVDPQQIKQVLANLITNAYQAMPNGGQLTLKTETEPGWVQLSVIDTGHGMSEEIAQKIFEPLFTTKAKGIGLGLAVSKNLVGVNGGRLEAHSVEGEGSTLTVTLPTKEAVSYAVVN